MHIITVSLASSPFAPPLFFSAIQTFSFCHAFILRICVVCVYWLNTQGSQAVQRGFKRPHANNIVLAGCFLSILSLVLCFTAGGWAMGLLAANVHMLSARHLVGLQRED